MMAVQVPILNFMGNYPAHVAITALCDPRAFAVDVKPDVRAVTEA